MTNRIAQSMCDGLIRLDIIDADLRDVYIYGIELILSFAYSVISIITFGIIVHRIGDAILFLVIFILIRRATGGFHASTYFRCQICTIAFYAIIMMLSLILDSSTIVKSILLFFGAIIIILIGPIENPNKQLDRKKRLRHKIIGTILFSTLGIAGLLIYDINAITINNNS